MGTVGVNNFSPTGLSAAYSGSVAIVAREMVGRLAWKAPARVATTGNVTIATALNAGDTIDGVVLAAGDRVLVWQQTAQEENGVYIVGATPFRAADFDASDEIVGSLVPVTAGTTHGGKLFRNTNTAAVVVDTDAITFEEFAASSPTIVDHGAMGATETLDLADGTVHRGTLDADCTITVQGFTVDEYGEMLVKLVQDGTGGWAITWDPDISWVGSDQPDQAASSVTWFVLWSEAGDATIYGAKVGAGGLTVEDEGTPLATLAETLNFVGAGVVASGTGVDKTVTISGAPSGAAGGDLSGTYPNPSVVDDSHSHTSSTIAAGVVGELLLSDAAGSPVVFGDILQNEAETDFLYADP